MFADEVRIKLEGGAIGGTFPVKAEETCCGHISWDGVPDEAGAMSGGNYEITVRMVNNEVVLTEKTQATDKGIRSEITGTTFVPVKKLPWTGKLSQTTVTLFRVQARHESRKSPNKTEHRTPDPP